MSDSSKNQKNTKGFDPATIGLQQALDRMATGSKVHTVRQLGNILLGADMDLELLIGLMGTAKNIRLSEPIASSTGHGFALLDDDGWLYVATSGG